ncbi:MAG: Ig-like domain repeat protein, partial [Terracidiphilus sp.]
DFQIEQGGSCVEGNVYDKGSTCRLLVRFTPQGPGNRLGKLTVANSISATPDAFGLGGAGYMPAVSFIPSIITTVSGTYPSSAGLLNGAQNLTVDGGDVLYIADIGNSGLRKIDSSGVITNITPFYSVPASIAVDSFGDIWAADTSGATYYLSEYSSNATSEDWPTTYVSSTCTVSAPCSFDSVGMSHPAEVSIDSSNNLFMEEETAGALEMPVGGWTGGDETLNLWHLDDQYAYYSGSPGSFAVSPSDDELFTSIGYAPGPTCYIVEESLYGAEGSSPNFTRVAGASNCGFSGDGGLGADAEIGSAVGQMAFDAAGDLYFTDTNNQRVRRIDYNSGVIRTIAGNGTAGYTDDGQPALNARLDNPTGVGVDSQGQVYIISGTGVSTAQVVRKVEATGYLSFGSVTEGSSVTDPVIVTNTGNNSLVLTSVEFTGTNPTDYSVDPTTTSCPLTAGATLVEGQTCVVGIKFTPAASGVRRANFVMLDNTATNSNTVELYGSGVLGTVTTKITPPTNGASFSSGTPVTLGASVTSSSGPAPTGTVQFKVDNTNYGSPVTISSGKASTSVTGLTTTSHTLSATYSGDSHYAAGRPISVSITVTGGGDAIPRVSLLPVMDTADASCHTNSYKATVTSKFGVPTGTVELMNGNTKIASSRLTNGQALLASPALPSGAYSFTARYSGDAHNPPAVSPALSQRILALPGCALAAGSPVLPERTELR